MKRKGILAGYCALLLVWVWIMPVAAAEDSDDITAMLTWWDEFGSDWEDAKELIEFAAMDMPLHVLAENTMEMQHGTQQQ